MFIFGKPPFFLMTPPTPPETRFPVNFWGRFGYALGHLWVNFGVPPRGGSGTSTFHRFPMSVAYCYLPTLSIAIPYHYYPTPYHRGDTLQFFHCAVGALWYVGDGWRDGVCIDYASKLPNIRKLLNKMKVMLQ